MEVFVESENFNAPKVPKNLKENKNINNPQHGNIDFSKMQNKGESNNNFVINDNFKADNSIEAKTVKPNIPQPNLQKPNIPPIAPRPHIPNFANIPNQTTHISPTQPNPTHINPVQPNLTHINPTQPNPTHIDSVHPTSNSPQLKPMPKFVKPADHIQTTNSSGINQNNNMPNATNAHFGEKRIIDKSLLRRQRKMTFQEHKQNIDFAYDKYLKNTTEAERKFTSKDNRILKEQGYHNGAVKYKKLKFIIPILYIENKNIKGTYIKKEQDFHGNRFNKVQRARFKARFENRRLAVYNKKKGKWFALLIALIFLATIGSGTYLVILILNPEISPSYTEIQLEGVTYSNIKIEFGEPVQNYSWGEIERGIIVVNGSSEEAELFIAYRFDVYDEDGEIVDFISAEPLYLSSANWSESTIAITDEGSTRQATYYYYNRVLAGQSNLTLFSYYELVLNENINSSEYWGKTFTVEVTVDYAQATIDLVDEFGECWQNSPASWRNNF